MNSPYFKTKLEPTNLATRERIFAGDVYLKGGGESSRKLVQKVIALLADQLQTSDIRKAHHKWSGPELFDHIGSMRRTLYLEPEFHQHVRDVAEECGFNPRRVAFDPIRIRVVLPGGHNNPLAAPVYYPHRDTWYAHPQSLVVWWLPLHDLRPDETFVFYPDFFAHPVKNDSEIFDYGDWVKDGPALKIGWQKRDSGATAAYPQSLQYPLPDHVEGFSCRAADNLIFAGSHYHKTLPQDFDTIRYSMDFRVVDLDDVAAGRGSPNADNRSRGEILKDYIQPVSPSA